VAAPADCRFPGDLCSGGGLQYNRRPMTDRNPPRRRILAFALLLPAMAACTSMLIGNPAPRDSAPVSGPAAPSAADNAISGEIRRQYSADADLRGYGIGIRTLSGTVTLTGTVGSYPHRDRAVQIARNTNGVRGVDNRIIVNTNL